MGEGSLSALSVLKGLRSRCRYGCFHINCHIAPIRDFVNQYDFTAGKSLCQVCSVSNGNCYNSCVATGTSGSWCCRNLQPGRCFTDGDSFLRGNGHRKAALIRRFGHDYFGIVAVGGCCKVVCTDSRCNACQRRDSRIRQCHRDFRRCTVGGGEGQCRSGTGT